MNCDTAQSRLLASERPDEPSAEVEAHLAACAACRVWQQRLAEVEQALPLLPVPASAARGELVQRVLSGPLPPPAEPAPEPPLLPLLSRPSLPAAPAKERGLRKLALAFALAAALGAFAVGWWAWPHQGPGRPDAADAVAVQREERGRLLREAASPRERVRLLARMVNDLHAEVRAHPEDPDRLALAARVYAEVVGEDLPAHARAVPAGERAEALTEIADSLGRAESEMERLAAAAASERQQTPLRAMAASAREGDRRLRALMRGENV
ncbi:MAG TPA: hypothetical protein VFE78_10560 [Gemmataceae bacterium]|jgi:hypothetical protein|nr:hypothetical protein [Gemmataceae bacterium]